MGGSGNDTITGGTGADVLSGGADSDTFIWVTGDGADTVEGNGGNDILDFTTTASPLTVSTSGVRALVGAVSTAEVEQLDIDTGAGNDTITINDLSSTSVSLVNLDAGDDTDTVEVDGTSGNDAVSIEENAGTVEVTGLSAVVRITNVAAGEIVRFDGNDGEDTLTSSGADPSVDVTAGRITAWAK